MQGTVRSRDARYDAVSWQKALCKFWQILVERQSLLIYGVSRQTIFALRLKQNTEWILLISQLGEPNTLCDPLLRLLQDEA